MKLKIEKLEIKLNRDGQEIGGMTKYGKPWRVLKINGEYDCADFLIKGVKEGDEIDCEIEETKYGPKIASIIPKEVRVSIDTFKKVVAKIKELDDRLHQVEMIVKP